MTRKTPGRERRFSVADVRERDDCAEVTFYESARVYRLLRSNPAYDRIVQALRSAASARTPATVVLDEPNGGVIESVRE